VHDNFLPPSFQSVAVELWTGFSATTTILLAGRTLTYQIDRAAFSLNTVLVTVPHVRMVNCTQNNFLSSYSFAFLIYLTGLRGRSQWPRSLRRGSVAARLLGLRVRIPPEGLISVSYDRCVLSGRGLCVALIIRPEES
jgi:hypothetical protein